jgi:hypothetical protein
MHLHLRRLNPGLGFLLKGVDDPNISANLNSVNNAESIPSMLKRNLKNPAVNTFERLGLVRFAALGSNRKCAQYIALHAFGKFFEIPPRRLDP